MEYNTLRFANHSNHMRTFEKEGTHPSQASKNAREVIDEFFFTFHLVEVSEYLRKISAALNDRNTLLSEKEKEEYVYFLERLNEMIAASYTLKS
jgi:hypothetical protein